MNTDCLLVITTCPNVETANRLAEALLAARAAACVNVVGPIASMYSWKDRLETASEQLLLIKTTDVGYDRVSAIVMAQHPYELPELIAVPIARGSDAYLAWIRSHIATGA